MGSRRNSFSCLSLSLCMCSNTFFPEQLAEISVRLLNMPSPLIYSTSRLGLEMSRHLLHHGRSSSWAIFVWTPLECTYIRSSSGLGARNSNGRVSWPGFFWRDFVMDEMLLMITTTTTTTIALNDNADDRVDDSQSHNVTDVCKVPMEMTWIRWPQLGELVAGHSPDLSWVAMSGMVLVRGRILRPMWADGCSSEHGTRVRTPWHTY